MKLVILAGGLGTRLSEETLIKPKPMIEIGGQPILLHIMQIYAAHGIKEFVVCCGYKGEQIKAFFASYQLMTSDIRVTLDDNRIEYLSPSGPDWTITLVDTGLSTQTGGRIKRIERFLTEDTFCLSYGDGVSDIDLTSLIAFHQSHESAATVTAVPSPGRFGILDLEGEDKVLRFHEKPDNEMGWINGGFFVLNKKILDYIDDDETIWERKPLQKLADEGELRAFRHVGFWRPMDTLRDRNELEEMWSTGKAPWKIWS